MAAPQNARRFADQEFQELPNAQLCLCLFWRSWRFAPSCRRRPRRTAKTAVTLSAGDGRHVAARYPHRCGFALREERSGLGLQPVPDERTALENEIARLQRENGALKKDMLARGLPLPGGFERAVGAAA